MGFIYSDIQTVQILAGGDYFALSNSFFRLLDHIKGSYPLTLNRDYANYFLVEGLASQSYSETLINEIKLTDRNSVFLLDIQTKSIQVDIKKCSEGLYSLGSTEGMSTLDSWFTTWVTIFRELKKRTDCYKY